MTRPTKAIIRLNALRHNYNQARLAAASSQVMAVIKADAYGHGIVPIAKALENADGFAVACLEEALTLREAGIKQKILLLEGVFSAAEIPLVRSAKLDLVVHTAEQVDLITKTVLADDNRLWLKLDTGMHRIGFTVNEFARHYQTLSEKIGNKSIVLMTHFANADKLDDASTAKQINLFKSTTKNIVAARSLCNSAAILSRPEAHADWIRPGIMLYGSSPFINETGERRNLLAVMQLESQIIAVRQFKKGDSVGYGGLFTCPEDMRVGIVAIGYGDGYPRHMQTGMPVIVDGRRTQLVGRVSMDMIAVDLRPIKNPRIGLKVELWGDHLSVDEVAQGINTISYELLCQISARVPREYVEN